jgi:hypothetical protein
MNRSLFSFTNAFRREASRRAPREVFLRSDDHWKLPRPVAEDSIRCLRGAVWITCEGQREDVVLTAGHAWQPTFAGVTVIGALSDAVISVGPTPLPIAA